ncbi:UbiD family decarboxylase [Trinickia symbiotica]|uniref:UbiD family decarboxylase n=1 Tax=Trinickia symbiotica TaxID=863227 RepID=A0A2T3XN29_9BURK|nr:UbiD family decarboxylase [Trinickia symbiotica]PTB17905.1 UbiD family decarboxylase [Trinickia symbiotica]
MNSRELTASASAGVREGGAAPGGTLRDWLAHLDRTGRLATIKRTVDLKHELAAVAKRLDGRQAACFMRPGSHSIAVVSGFMSRRAWIAEAMGVSEDALLRRFSDAAVHPLPWREVGQDEAACQQIVHTAGIDLYALLPIPTHSEHDNGPYITAGLVIARNPRTGIQNVSINRIQVHGPDRMGILMLPRHLHEFYSAAEANGEPLDVAIAIGVDPLTLLASQAITPIDHDELEIAGALHGAPLPVVKCKTSEVRVPANAEIVIEGRILPGAREMEGPFGEFPKYYSAREAREVIEVRALTHRRHPIYHTIVPAEMEHLLLGAIPREATLLAHLQRSHPNVKDVELSVGGVCRYHLWVQLDKKREGEAKNVILCAFGAHYDIKQVVVVDTDVDVHDPAEVEWAIATRFQADRDLVVIEGAQGSVLDPSTTVGLPDDAPPHMQGISAKMGLDATRPLVYSGHVFTRVRIPGFETADLAALVAPDNAAFGTYMRRSNG